jgi:hypothetical protein
MKTARRFPAALLFMVSFALVAFGLPAPQASA